MMHTQRFLRQYSTSAEALQRLEEQYAIKARVYEEDNLVLLDYNQIESPKAHPITIECRSLILRLSDFEVVSRKFDRFFNYGECADHYTDFSFQGSLVMEKADGSLIGVYFNEHTKRWEISTRGMAKAEGEHMMGGSFRDRVLKAFGFNDESEFQNLFKNSLQFLSDTTFIFEYTSPENRIVTKYEKDEMVLTGVRYVDGREAEDFKNLAHWFQQAKLNVRLPKMYDVTKDLDALVEVADALQDLAEGFVVWDPKSGKRVKIKSKTYLIAHRLRGNDTVPTKKNLFMLVLEGEVDEFLAYFPEWGKVIGEVQTTVKFFEEDLSVAWEKYGMIEDQKEFALKVKDLIGSGFLFQAKKLKKSPVIVFHESEIGRKLKAFDL
jgi:T4 RnlA family RNA ligase